MATRITASSNPTLYIRLMNAYVIEGRPVSMSVGNVHYKVIQNTDGDIEFEIQTEQSLYDSVSL